MSCIYCRTNGIHAPGCPKDAGNRIVEIHPRGEHVEMSNRDEDEYDFYPQSGEQVITLRLREWEDFSFSDDADLDN